MPAFKIRSEQLGCFWRRLPVLLLPPCLLEEPLPPQVVDLEGRDAGTIAAAASGMLGSRDPDRAGGFHLFQRFGFAVEVVGRGGFVGSSCSRSVVIQLADVVARAEILDLARDFFERGAAFLEGGSAEGGGVGALG